MTRCIFAIFIHRYTKDSATGVEETNLVVIKGTPTTGTANDPEITKGDIINDHVLVNDMPLYRVPFDGLNIQDLVCLFEVLPSWKTLKAQSIEETQTAIQKAAEQKLDQSINVIEQQMNKVVAEAEDAVARVPAVKQGTTGCGRSFDDNQVRFFNAGCGILRVSDNNQIVAFEPLLTVFEIQVNV